MLQKTLKQNREKLTASFIKGKVPNFLDRNAQLIDDYFCDSFAESKAGLTIGIAKNPYAIIALGGYGRREQCIHSDVDFLVLFRDKIPEKVGELVREFVYPLWDVDLEIGYAVRTIEDCVKLSSKSLETLTALLDARFICGASDLFWEFEDLFIKTVIKPESEVIIKLIIDRNRKRHERFGDSTYLLEPNIKDGQGGLRDYHAMLWFAGIKKNFNRPRDLEYNGCISREEKVALQQSLNYIWNVRNRLHFITGRKCDQLYFEHQISLATMLKLKEKNGQRPVEIFLSTLHGKMENLKQYHLMQIDMLKLSRQVIIKQQENVVVFERILVTQSRKYNVLFEMHNTGFLGQFIPEFRKIENRIQYNQYHLYPVDLHSLRTVQVLKDFRNMNGGACNKLCSELYCGLKRRKLLLWAALLHDIGKADSDYDHSKTGAKIARVVLKRSGIEGTSLEDIVFLIENHLFLVKIATRRDLHDEDTIFFCAGKIKDATRLKMLFLLTIADSIATGPKAWNEWTAHLLHDLFSKVLDALKSGELSKRNALKNLGYKKNMICTCAKTPAEKKKLLAKVETMSIRYLLSTSSRDIQKHIRLYENLGSAEFVWEIDRKEGSGLRTVTICGKERSGFFSKAAGVFALNGIWIVEAQGNVWGNNIAFDIFRVKPPVDLLYEDKVWEKTKKDLNLALQDNTYLSVLHKSTDKVGMQRRTKPHSIEPYRINFDNHSSRFFTIIEVFSSNYNGLLFRITDVLDKCELDIRIAKISTKVDQVVNVFYVRSAVNGLKINKKDTIESIKKLEIVVEAKRVSQVIDMIVNTASTGKIGDGKI
ncbi:MAG: hypothetical protein B6I31_05695, partial [Desulfobacteraceae bacterium 4572_19]